MDEHNEITKKIQENSIFGNLLRIKIIENPETGRCRIMTNLFYQLTFGPTAYGRGSRVLSSTKERGLGCLHFNGPVEKLALEIDMDLLTCIREKAKGFDRAVESVAFFGGQNLD